MQTTTVKFNNQLKVRKILKKVNNNLEVKDTKPPNESTGGFLL